MLGIPPTSRPGTAMHIPAVLLFAAPIAASTSSPDAKPSLSLCATPSLAEKILRDHELHELLSYSKPGPEDLARIAALSVIYAIASVQDAPALAMDLQPMLMHNVKIDDTIDHFTALVPTTLRSVTGENAHEMLLLMKRLWRSYNMSIDAITSMGNEARRMVGKPKVDVPGLMRFAHTMLVLEYPPRVHTH